MEYPPWWPRGVDPDNLCPVHCDYCRELRERLADHRAGVALTGEDATLDSFADA